jgi:hypothetical protein
MYRYVIHCSLVEFVKEKVKISFFDTHAGANRIWSKINKFQDLLLSFAGSLLITEG